MPFLCKHFQFNCYVSTPISINSITYYKYDIDLRKYTAKGIIQEGPGSGDSYRILKFRAFYSTMLFNTIVNGLPNVLYYDIFMSFKAVAAPPGEAGLNITAVGFPVNLTLTNIPQNNIFLIRNGTNSLDYISLVSTNIANVSCVIEDLLS